MRTILTLAMLAAWASLLSMPARADEPAYMGRWAVDPSWCGNSPDTTDQVPMQISGTDILGYESSCRIASVTPIGDYESAWEVRTSCMGEGETWEQKQVWGVDIDLDTGTPKYLARINLDDGFVSVFHRCK